MQGTRRSTGWKPSTHQGLSKTRRKPLRCLCSRNNPPTHSERQISSAPEDRHEVVQGTVTEDGEIIEHEETKPTKRNSAGTAYPTPPEDVIAHLRERRYVKWLTWAEQVATNAEVKDGAAFAEDFKGVIGWVRKYGGAHWRRCKALFGSIGITLED